MITVKNKKLRTVLKYALIFAAIPAAVAIGAFFGGVKNYAIICALIAVLSFVIFISGFEKRKTGSRRLVLAAVFTALAVAGRFIPVLKPAAVMVIFSGMYLGGETGFLTGTMFAIISDLYFGVGPWTPFQMLAWGLTGFFAGVLSKPLENSRAVLAVYAAVSGVMYSFVMDIWTVMWYNGSPELSLYKTALVSAVPFTLIYVVSNVLFALLFIKPFSRKMKRIKLNYGI